MRVLTCCSLLLAMACTRTRDQAPEDLDGLFRYTFRTFEDPDRVTDAVQGLADWMDTTGRTESAREGLRLTPLTADDTVDVDVPTPFDPANADGVAAGGISPFSLDAHAALLPEIDQTYLDPRNYPRYNRAILEGNADDFLAGVATLRTLNDIERRNVGVSIPFMQRKDYQWVAVSQGRLLVARSWIPDASCSASGDNCVRQGYAVDLMLDDGAAGVVRLTSSWSEVTTLIDGVLSDDQLVAVAVNGILEVYDNTDAHLARLAEDAR